MRRFLLLCGLLAAGATPSAALAGGGQEPGFVVFKDFRTYAVTELRDAATGRVVASEVSAGEDGADAACTDPKHKFFGARWKAFEPYLVNVASFPAYLKRAEVLADLTAAHAAWENPFVTDCLNAPGPSRYDAVYGGETRRLGGSLAQLLTDGFNVVEFRSLDGTLCAGALACVIAEFKGGTINEADFLLEADLAAAGFNEVWTTEDTTDPRGTSPRRFAVIDVATHEWGHFAGLDHTKKSPELTMYPFIRDGMQTLGLGDMRGLLSLY